MGTVWDVSAQGALCVCVCVCVCLIPFSPLLALIKAAVCVCVCLSALFPFVPSWP